MGPLNIQILSEVGKLNTVITHEPGKEVEIVTPATAEKALYGDILNTSVAKKEYTQFIAILKKCCNVLSIKDMFTHYLKDSKSRLHFFKYYFSDKIDKINQEYLLSLGTDVFFNQIIEGIDYQNNTLTHYINHNQFVVTPLHNLFFTRDIAFAQGKQINNSKMAKGIRMPEAKLLSSILQLSGLKDESRIQLDTPINRGSIEGGDVLVVNKETLIIGMSDRTTSEGIDYFIQNASKDIRHIIVQELPKKALSFIHLDMVFTILDTNDCMVYRPVIFNPQLQTILITINNGKIKHLQQTNDILGAMVQIGLDYRPVFCGNGHKLFEEREQWHSGANFFALEPGKIIGYERNVHTNEALNAAGYEIVNAEDFISSAKTLGEYKKCVITIDGSELARGGGGPRCMTLPVHRDN